MPAIVVAIVLALTASLSGGVTYAAQGALPGDLLYPVRQTVDGLQASMGAEEGLATAMTVAGTARSRSVQEMIRASEEITGTPTVVTPTPEADPEHSGGRPTVTISGTLGITFTNTISDVLSLADDPVVPGKSYMGLLAKLQQAEAAIERGRDRVAIHKLDAFLSQLDAMQRSGHISSEDYDALVAEYDAIVAELNADAQSTDSPAATRKGGPKAHHQAGPDGADDEATPTPDASPTQESLGPSIGPGANGKHQGRPTADERPGSDHPSAASPPGRSKGRR